VAWHWTACHPLAVGFLCVAELLGYLFCLHLVKPIVETSRLRCLDKSCS
jgi:hypothetical protein